MSSPRYVKIGNVYDTSFDPGAYDPRLARSRKLRERMAGIRRAPVWDARAGALEDDESGLTVHHELDPDLKVQVQRLSESIRSRGVWISALGGLLLGLLLAGLAWWGSSVLLKATRSRK